MEPMMYPRAAKANNVNEAVMAADSTLPPCRRLRAMTVPNASRPKIPAYMRPMFHSGFPAESRQTIQINGR